MKNFAVLLLAMVALGGSHSRVLADGFTYTGSPKYGPTSSGPKRKRRARPGPMHAPNCRGRRPSGSAAELDCGHLDRRS